MSAFILTLLNNYTVLKKKIEKKIQLLSIYNNILK